MRILALVLILAPAVAMAQYQEPLSDLRVSAQGGLLTYTGEAARYTTPGVAYGVTVGSDISRWFAGELQ